MLKQNRLEFLFVVIHQNLLIKKAFGKEILRKTSFSFFFLQNFHVLLNSASNNKHTVYLTGRKKFKL